jgi:hypothetical protein
MRILYYKKMLASWQLEFLALVHRELDQHHDDSGILHGIRQDTGYD